jgi:hypothetical protein
MESTITKSNFETRCIDYADTHADPFWEILCARMPFMGLAEIAFGFGETWQHDDHTC